MTSRCWLCTVDTTLRVLKSFTIISFLLSRVLLAPWPYTRNQERIIENIKRKQFWKKKKKKREQRRRRAGVCYQIPGDPIRPSDFFFCFAFFSLSFFLPSSSLFMLLNKKRGFTLPWPSFSVSLFFLLSVLWLSESFSSFMPGKWMINWHPSTFDWLLAWPHRHTIRVEVASQSSSVLLKGRRRPVVETSKHGDYRTLFAMLPSCSPSPSGSRLP